MSESFRGAVGRKVVSRATAHELGAVSHLVPSVDCGQISALVVGKGRKASVVRWSEVTGFGVSAVMISDDSALREPEDGREQEAAGGKLELVGARVLSELGNRVGLIDDVLFDPTTGAVEALNVGDRAIPAQAVLGCGAYAVVVSATEDPL